MKKLYVLVACILATVTFSQSVAQSNYECRTVLDNAFGTYSSDEPVKLRRLGTSPQFGEIRTHTSEAAYKHLSRVYNRNSRKSRVEMDRLLRLLGYTGFKDAAFDESKIVAEILPASTVGWMGAYSRGYKYRWSELGRDFKTFKILSKDGPCYLYIMRKCGNAFYIPNNPTVYDCPPCPDCPRPLSFVANADPYCPACAPCPPPCKTSTINVSGEGKITSGDMIEETVEAPIVASFGGESLCIGTYTIPVKSTYEYTATGATAYSEAIELCDNGAGVLPQMDLKLPVSLKMDVTNSDISVGNDGSIVLNIPNEKRFKQMKKIYAACPADVSAAAPSALMANEFDEVAMAESNSTAGAGSEDSYCTKQTLYFSGAEQVSEVVEKNYSNTVTVVGHYVKSGKLAKGESADKFLCLGTYAVPGSSSMVYNLKGESNLTKVLEVCDKDGMAPAQRTINVPVEMDLAMNNQQMEIGNGNRITIPLTEKEYKKLGKRFSRCCSDGSKGCF